MYPDARKHLVPGAALPEVTLVGGGRSGSVTGIHDLAVLVLLVHSAGAAGEEHEKSGNQEQDHGSKLSPHTNTKLGTASAGVSVGVDMVLDDAEEGEVASKNNDGDNPSEERSGSSKDGTDETCAESEEEGNEGESASNGVQDHDAGQGLGCVFRSSVEAGLVDLGHDIGGVVADVYTSAPVCVGVICGSDVKHTMSECTECDGRMAD